MGNSCCKDQEQTQDQKASGTYKEQGKDLLDILDSYEPDQKNLKTRTENNVESSHRKNDDSIDEKMRLLASN